MSRKMYKIKVQLQEMNGSKDMSHMPQNGLMEVGMEGLDIVDAINALGTVFPKGTVFDVLSAELEGIFENKEEVEAGTHVKALEEGADLSAEELADLLDFDPSADTEDQPAL